MTQQSDQPLNEEQKAAVERLLGIASMAGQPRAHHLFNVLNAVRAVGESGRVPHKIAMTRECYESCKAELGGVLAVPAGGHPDTVFGIRVKVEHVPNGAPAAIYASQG